ncbi:beta-galactosidase [Solimonas marina]|uniref:beta-galactosidase n=1 Tax=Solimonas marina TaxID=2714601 RepID=A0A969WBF7_9GAMM|nr:beta-galactosidase [Solimonas marina]NKF24092.1 beta-galactosidase [Solimonas marina]
MRRFHTATALPAGIRVAARAAVIAALLAGAPLACAAAAGDADAAVQWDRHSLLINGQRQFIWSGEMHPFRLPSPSLWRDVLEKMKASGYNTVSFYFGWTYHSPKPGVYDFSGVRDLDRLLDIAHDVGLYVIARPGPYMNAEVTRGGFPGWLNRQHAKARTDDPEYLAAADQWMSQINAIIARHQIDRGGSVILYQIENELAPTAPTQQRYMQHLDDLARKQGITVPIFHNDQGRNGRWVPRSSDVDGTVPGPNDLYAFDGYPGGPCGADATVGKPNHAPDWGLYSPGGARGGASASPQTPGFTAEFGGGWFDYWGSVGTYGCTAQRQGSGYERVFYGTNIVNGLAIENFYMTFGGTSWGWLPAPVVYTSYDYGAAIDEGRRLRPKAATMKLLGEFISSVKSLAYQVKAAPIAASTADVRLYHNLNPDDGTQFIFARHEPSNATDDVAFTFPLSTPDGDYHVPAQGTLRLNGQYAKLLLADYDFGHQHLVYSTSQLQTQMPFAGGDLALLYAPQGDDGETVLRYARRPKVEVLAGKADVHYDTARGDLRLDYRHDGLIRIRIDGGGRPPLTLLLADEAEAERFWRSNAGDRAVLTRGPALVRAATIRGRTLQLRGDTTQDSALEVWAPPGVQRIEWNGGKVPMHVGVDSSLVARHDLPGPVAPTLPDLMRLTWRYHAGSPEAAPDFDDHDWRHADLTDTASTTPPPAGQPVLTMADYGFHNGDVWYRGRYRIDGTTSPARIALHYGGGGAGLLQAWLDGHYLGEHVISTGLPRPPTTATAHFAIPQALRGDGPHLLSVMVRNDADNWDLFADDAHKEGRGLIDVHFDDADGHAVAIAPQWRIQGTRGGEDLIDTARGPLNNGGLYGERVGWHLPGFPDGDWRALRLADAPTDAGTTWLRTQFKLNVPAGEDASLALRIGDADTPRSGAHYRVLIFLNGWMMGQYIADVGPQHDFVLPNGILDPRGDNTLALAVTGDGRTSDVIEPLRLIDLQTVRGGVPLQLVASPPYTSP